MPIIHSPCPGVTLDSRVSRLESLVQQLSTRLPEVSTELAAAKKETTSKGNFKDGAPETPLGGQGSLARMSHVSPTAPPVYEPQPHFNDFPTVEQNITSNVSVERVTEQTPSSNDGTVHSPPNPPGLTLQIILHHLLQIKLHHNLQVTISLLPNIVLHHSRQVIRYHIPRVILLLSPRIIMFHQDKIPQTPIVNHL